MARLVHRSFIMPVVTLRDLYAAELHDLVHAEQQIIAELSDMRDRATSARLQRALDEHHAETAVQIERLTLLLQQLNEPAREFPSRSITAIIDDARRRFDDTERGETLDAALIAAAQRIEHYEMASYGTARSYAEALGDYDAARILQQTLDEEGHTDHMLTRLAERGINQAAGDDLLEQSTRYRSRLRFLGAADVPEVAGRDVHLHNEEGDHLGTLDGFIVDSESGRPIYYVIDSRGWFAGRRYVVPVGQVETDRHASALRTSLTRADLKRYPEFSPSAFTAMDDNDAVRYERRLHRVFAPDSPAYDGRPTYENAPVYAPPIWVMPGIWTDASEAPAAPRRAGSDAGAQPASDTRPRPPDERPADRHREVVVGGQRGKDTAPEPRIERYRER